VRAKKHLGQNFLKDESVVDRIIDGLNLNSADTVAEIGPGMGALTGKLAQKAGQVIAIEFDRDMVAHLQREFSETPNLAIVQADALTIELDTILPESGVKLAANLPYYISTPILQRLAAERNRFSSLVIMLQKEVVDRIVALPGSSERGYLTVIVENAFTAERLFDVPPEAFSPRPKVDSSVIRLTPKAEAASQGTLEPLLSIAFRQKRKTIGNNLKNDFSNYIEALAEANIDPVRRAETLTLDEWKAIVRTLVKK